MIPDLQQAHQAIQNARTALRTGDAKSALQWAQRAAALAPNLEESWLILAAASDPQSSVHYLQRALKINPGSQRARAGLEWAKRRLQEERRSPLSSSVPLLQKTEPPAPKSSAGRRILLPGLLIFLCLVLIVSAGFGVSPALAFLRASASTPTLAHDPQSWAQVDVEKPTYTPTPTDTPTATPTDTPTPIPTDTPTPTPTDTATPIPTDTPVYIPIPTDTPQPYVAPTQPVVPTQQISSSGEHWLEVNLTEQRLYAYAGDTLVASFVVSTGTWEHPTVTGRYHVYMKLRYDNMSGPGYDLPNVPYTMYFHKGYAVHGTYWHNNFGTPMSHGCVNLSISDAEWVYNFSSVGTLVYVHY